jgi:sodium-dependent phosphate cotransporter
MYDRRNKDEFVSDVFVEGGGGSEDIYGEKEEYYQDGEIATCRDVLAFCFKRSFLSWMSVVGHFVIFVGFVYGYFFGIVLLGAGAEVVGGCQIGSLFENTTNPITYILVGILTTCICQSSTAANFVIGSLVGDILSVQNGIYIMMGANLGNTVINSILVLVHGFNKSELERVVAGASVNDFFFFYAILIFLPLEAVSGILYHLAGTLIPDSLSEGYQWTGFTGNFIVPLVRKIILPNEVRSRGGSSFSLLRLQLIT